MTVEVIQLKEERTDEFVGEGSRRKWGEGEVGVAMKGQRDRFPCADGGVSTWVITVYVIYCILSCKVLSLGGRKVGKVCIGSL